ncbi:Arylsulfatase B [Orchesella cincta]|uniref:Arylsulfatase B n=1 Tax=Orchesella cincta TaxID=48709 RepID=A0A1D2MVN0_ORCCI|nr:Arylsulfatase B [Orchesella cincta]
MPKLNYNSKVVFAVRNVLLLLSVGEVVGSMSVSSSLRPNIIFILADDAGWNDFSFHGSAQIPTPNIDALAFSGAVLNNYYTSPLCTPSRGAIVTGKHPIHIGLQHYVIRGDTASGLPLSEKILPEYMKELGYSTHLVGKWHLGHAERVYSPTYRGFDSHYGYWLGNQDYYDHTSTDAGYWGYDFRNNMTIERPAFGEYNTDIFTQESVRIIQQQETDKPLFLMVTHTAPHSGNEYNPLQAPQENIDKFQDSIEDENRRVYAAMVDKLDESVGRIVAALGEKGMLNNSVVIFASDNGGAPEGYNLNYGSNWPLRGVKNTLWEGGTRVAACIWSPNIMNRVSSDMMHASDWLPTLYEAAGGNVTNLGQIDGLSLWNTLTTGESSPRHEFLYNLDDIYNNSAVRFESWKLIQGNISTLDFDPIPWDGWYGHYPYNTTVADLVPQILGSRVATALQSIGFSLETDTVKRLQEAADIKCNETLPEIACNPYAEPCLFNIVEDPCEKRNLAGEESTLVAQLLALLNSYNSTAREVIDLSHNPEAAPYNWDYVWTNWKDYL